VTFTRLFAESIIKELHQLALLLKGQGGSEYVLSATGNILETWLPSVSVALIDVYMFKGFEFEILT
jgi:hypothetical protein